MLKIPIVLKMACDVILHLNSTNIVSSLGIGAGNKWKMGNLKAC